MQMKSLLDQYKEAFSEDNDQYCAYCLVVDGGHGCDCDQKAWRYFHELDDKSQLRLINQEIGTAFEGAKQ